MPLFSRKPQCPACGQKSVDTEQGIWVCTACIANGPISNGQPLDLGLRGWPRRGEFEQYEPAVSVAAQLAPQAPEQFAPLLADPEASERFNQAAFDFFAAFTGTSFDLEDEELEAAQAMQARTAAGDRNLRADDPRFYLLTACSQNGWQWRRAEEQGGVEALIPEVRERLARYQRENGEAQSRSEVISLTAMAIVDTEALELRLYPDSDVGYASLLGGWLLSYWLLLAPQPQFLQLHPSELLINTFRFGVALRDAEIAYDLANGGSRRRQAAFPEGIEVSHEVRELCEEHGMDFGHLYAETHGLIEASLDEPLGEGEVLLWEKTAATRHCRIVVAGSAGLISSEDDVPINVALRAVRAAVETENEEMVRTAYAHYDAELAKLIEEAGLVLVVEALDGMILADQLD